MGKFKSMLPEDYTNEPTLEPITPDTPGPADYYMAELERICCELTSNIPYGYKNELEGLIRVLENVLEYVRKPF